MYSAKAYVNGITDKPMRPYNNPRRRHHLHLTLTLILTLSGLAQR